MAPRPLSDRKKKVNLSPRPNQKRKPHRRQGLGWHGILIGALLPSRKHRQQTLMIVWRTRYFSAFFCQSSITHLPTTLHLQWDQEAQCLDQHFRDFATVINARLRTIAYSCSRTWVCRANALPSLPTESSKILKYCNYSDYCMLGDYFMIVEPDSPSSFLQDSPIVAATNSIILIWCPHRFDEVPCWMLPRASNGTFSFTAWV
jgi:hypothetical protein